ncbi:hypothetical protein EC973_001682 [Apophysomyces ossiformis]|uniref:Uncharacterized protein n=1 Tax=Apophysomyces ossiformis TaxID=679940 RepID=A0A8H7BHL7_9FUNG|nr:hypothetical protein EC973_001682 [Apophysomyces ossiformis]
MPLVYWISAAIIGFIQFILLVLAGVYRSTAVAQCQQDTAWPEDACRTAITIAYAFLGLSYVVWSGLQVYFSLVIQALALKTEGRMRYSALKDQYMRDWDERIEMNGGIPRVGSVRSNYSVV